MLSRERRVPTKSERQAGPGLRGGVDCKVQVDNYKLQKCSCFGKRDFAGQQLPICNVHFAICNCP